ncbi:cold shock protein 2 [mine drainage metagenome]|uniref:Cold shock protein 2 n=1 Tax=mine drainage metagenome TaxID=410659 RepID=A0A1J5PYS1_9ZZZZ
MQTPLQITLRNMPHSDALETRIRDRVQKLESMFAHVISCRVVVEVPHRHQNQGKQFNVRIDIGVPGEGIVVNRDHHEDVYVALHDAFDAAMRQLEDYVRKLMRETKAHPPRQVGRVSRISHNEGFGFVLGADGRECYFHRDNVVSPGFDRLMEGDEVKFIEEMGAEGPQAKRISVGHHHLPG